MSARRQVIKIPSILFIILIPFIFLGGCVASIPTTWKLLEKKKIRPYTDSDASIFPVLAQSEAGSFEVAWLGDSSDNLKLVTDIEVEDLPSINRDLRESIGYIGDYDFASIKRDLEGKLNVSLEFPTTRNVKYQSWYYVQDGVIYPEEILAYGPGFAVMTFPYGILAGIISVVIFILVFKRKKKLNKPGA